MASVAQLIETYERRRAEASQVESTVPAAKVYELVLQDLQGLDPVDPPSRLLTTEEAGEVLRIVPKTVRSWCRDGRFPGAKKTSKDGEWRIPAHQVYRELGSEPSQPRHTPRLWRPDDERS